MRSLAALVLLTIFADCSRLGIGETARSTAPLTPAQTLNVALQSAMSDESLGALAARKARLPETRQFGQSMEKEAAALRNDLTALAQARHLPIPSALAEKQVALRENLEILPGQVLDSAYSLAMVQELTATMEAFDRLAATDRELAEVGKRHKAALGGELKSANAALERVGGSPFGFIP